MRTSATTGRRIEQLKTFGGSKAGKLRRPLTSIGLRVVANALVASLAAASAVSQEGTERFLTLESWAGRVQVTVTGDGTLEFPQATLQYTIRRHLDYFFDLKSFLACTWISCSTVSNPGEMNDSYVQTIFGRGKSCITDYTRKASGVLNDDSG